MHLGERGVKNFLSYEDLKKRGVPWTRQHLLRLEKLGKFPRRVRLGDSTVGWLDDEIDEWSSDKEAARSNGSVVNKPPKPRAVADLALRVEHLGLSPRGTHALVNDGVDTLAKLLAKSETDLLGTPNIGRITLHEIKAMLGRRELRLGMKIPRPPGLDGPAQS